MTEQAETPQPYIPLACPYRGLAHEQEIRLNFASLSTHCHKGQPVERVTLAHQEAFCLTDAYRQCPVYLRQETAPLPDDVAYRPPPEGTQLPNWVIPAAGVVGLFIFVILIALIWPSGRGQAGDVPIANTPTLAALAMGQTATPLLTAEPTEPPTASATPTANPTTTPTRASAETATQPPPTARATAVAAAATPTTVPASATPSATPVPSPPQADFRSERVTLRTGPGNAYVELDSTVTVTNTQFTLAGVNEAGTWVQLCCLDDGGFAWALRTELANNSGIEQLPVVADPPARIIVSAERVNVRRGPGLAYEPIAIIERGETYPLVARNWVSDWWQICCFDDAVGWVYSAPVMVSGDAAAAPVATDIPPEPTETPAP